MIQIELDSDEGVSIVEGGEEFLALIERNSMAEVRDISTGQKYFAHEVGDEFYFLTQPAQSALERLAHLLIDDIASRPLH